MDHYEIERRFLLYPCSAKGLLKHLGVGYEKVAMAQFYLEAGEEGVVRYRREGGRYILTLKRGAGLKRLEEEREIPKKEYEAALAKNRGLVIRKNRYRFGLEGWRFELDSFKKPFKGLKILEIEFESVEVAESFRLPAALAKAVVAEVTGVPGFSNGALSRSGRIPALSTSLPALLAKVDEREDFLKASVRVPLGAYESGGHALKAIFHSLLRSVEANRRAILSGDEDPERLHQLRVAMRKMRALLSQMAPLFDPDWAAKTKESLAALMRRTGPKRDLDVYLARIDLYRSLLPERHHEGLARFAGYLRRLEREEAAGLESFLRDEAFVSQMASLEDFSRDEGVAGLSPEAEGPVILPVKRRLFRRYERLLKRGGAIGPKAEAAAYHEVRIEVKKLRYLMEFFASLFEESAYTESVAVLKKIQTILGEHQDLDVQRRHMLAFAKEGALKEKATREALEALAETMERLERKKRREFREAFARFAQTRRLLKRMVCHR
ncbi:CHAD domain-containing protein [Hydrogenimonas sp.]